MPSKRVGRLENPYKKGIEIIAQRDPIVESMYECVGLPEVREIEDHWHSLIKLIVEQQVSIAAAEAIWQRLHSQLPNDYRAVDLSEETISATGLSRPKIVYFFAVIEALKQGQLDMVALREMGEQEVVKTLISIKGLGPWSAQCYLLFALKREDVFPSGDLALLRAWQYALNHESFSAKELVVRSKDWQPYRSAIALLSWKYYAHKKRAE